MAAGDRPLGRRAEEIPFADKQVRSPARLAKERTMGEIADTGVSGTDQRR